MNINIETKYSVGDTVYAVRFTGEYKENYGIEVEARKISSVKVIFADSKFYICYFLKGLDSWEGENWFDEEPGNFNGCDAIYPTKEIAEQELRNYVDKGRTGEATIIPPNDEIWYTSDNNHVVIPNEDNLTVNIVSNIYKDGKGIIKFESDITALDDDIFNAYYDGSNDDCAHLVNVFIPISVTRIGDEAFSGCAELRKIDIPDSVTSIGHNAFCDCRNLLNMEIPESVTFIGDGAFSGCFSMEYLEIPVSVTSIGRYAFYMCHNLTSVIIPGSVTRIEDYTFAECTKLDSVIIPYTMTSIGKAVFADSPDMDSIIYGGTTDEWKAITKDKEWYHNIPNVKEILCKNGSVSLD